jgi:hypothetical protein
MSPTDSEPIAPPKSQNPSVALQLVLLLDIFVRTMIWAIAMSVTLLVLSRTAFVRTASWETLKTWSGAWACATTFTNFILLFNVAYVLTLVIVRLPFPSPQSGVYRTDRGLDRNIILSGFLGVLTKARFHAPFPAFLVGQIASIMPFRWLLSRTMGPRTRSSFFLDPNVIDPWGTQIGKNVTIGFGSTITCHLQERDYIIIDRVVIEDDVSIGAYAGISGGVHIKRGAVIEPYAAIKPRTVVGEYEFWGGRPAYLKATLRPGRTERRAPEPKAPEEPQTEAKPQ